MVAVNGYFGTKEPVLKLIYSYQNCISLALNSSPVPLCRSVLRTEKRDWVFNPQIVPLYDQTTDRVSRRIDERIEGLIQSYDMQL